MILSRVGLVVFGLLVAGCAGGDSGSTSPLTTGGSACSWLTVETVEKALGVAAAQPPGELTDDHWWCVWRGSDAELTIQFDRFTTGRSVAAELNQLRDTAEDGLVVVSGLQGAFPRPGVWRGETALRQYGMMTVEFTNFDGTEPDLTEFKPVVTAVINNVFAAAPSVPE